jgi:hypothetical protein
MLARLLNTLNRALGLGARKDRARLLQICFGDQTAVDRLIEGERSRAPGIPEAEACRRAIQRVRRDNR